MKKNIDLLWVEDDADDVILFREGMKQCGLPYDLVLFDHPDDAIKHLGRSVLPDVILLDLKMPTTDGHTVLAYLKASAQYRHVPVFILSSSTNPLDAEKSLLLGAARYFIKPVLLDDWHHVCTAIFDAAGQEQKL